jgi:hypothetical protein
MGVACSSPLSIKVLSVIVFLPIPSTEPLNLKFESCGVSLSPIGFVIVIYGLPYASSSDVRYVILFPALSLNLRSAILY